MKALLLALATAVPKYVISQSEIAEWMVDALALKRSDGSLLRKVYKGTAIKTRHSVLPDFQRKRSEWTFWGEHFPHTIPGMGARNEVYKTEAPTLTHQAAAKALKEWGGPPNKITHVIAVSCTGVVAPGIEFGLINSLGLNRSVARFGINFMGCFGAFKALAAAAAFAKENPDNRVLIVCTELCSLHFQAGLGMDTLVANALFSDGAAAAVIGGSHNSSEKPLWEIIRSHAMGFEGSMDKMTWEASDTGYLMTLSQDVPKEIGAHITPFSRSLLGHKLSHSDCDWAIHPGGKRIITTIEEVLSLQPSQTHESWKTLENYGNMSSATFLFVLDLLRRRKEQREWAAGVGFGPGLSMEGILLKKWGEHPA